MHPVIEQMKKGSIRGLAKAITLVENDDPAKLEILSALYKHQQGAHFIGITGSPGSGKSTLVNKLISHIRAKGLTVAVIAVDPTSPFSGGALLGDRVRMNEHFTDDGVFIRSMATRGSLGGLARATKDVIRVCDGFGFDVILVETVGVGQSELDIMKIVDTTMLVLSPNSGDALQVFKAGIMEIADLFVINKADLPGTGKLRGLLKDLVRLTEADYQAEIIKTTATENKGIERLWKSCEKHHAFLHETAAGKKKRKVQQRHEIYELIQEEIWRDVNKYLNEEQDFTRIRPNSDPYEQASFWYEKWKKEK